MMLCLVVRPLRRRPSPPCFPLLHLGHPLQTASPSSFDCPNFRVGELAEEVYQHYLTELRRVQPDMADAYENTTHCSVPFHGHHDAQAREGMAAWR